MYVCRQSDFICANGFCGRWLRILQEKLLCCVQFQFGNVRSFVAFIYVHCTIKVIRDSNKIKKITIEKVNNGNNSNTNICNNCLALSAKQSSTPNNKQRQNQQATSLRLLYPTYLEIKN